MSAKIAERVLGRRVALGPLHLAAPALPRRLRGGRGAPDQASPAPPSAPARRAAAAVTAHPRRLDATAGLDPARNGRHGRQPHPPRPALDRPTLPDLRHRRLLGTAAHRRPRRLRQCHVRGSDHYNGLAVDIVPRAELDLRRRWTRDHRDSRSGPSRCRTSPSALPLGRLRRRCRPRLRPPPPPLLEPRPGAAVPARRMGRSLPVARTGSRRRRKRRRRREAAGAESRRRRRPRRPAASPARPGGSSSAASTTERRGPPSRRATP